MAPDTDKQTCLLWDWDSGSGPCIIQPTVFAAGYDTKFLVAESHPDENAKVTAFWYIVRDPATEDRREGVSRAKVKGPFSEHQFTSLKAQLKLPEFSVIYTNLK